MGRTWTMVSNDRLGMRWSPIVTMTLSPED